LAREHKDFSRSALGREPVIDYGSLFRLAARGDDCARSLARHSLEVWSALAVSLIHAFDPELLILGGGVMGSADAILPAVRDYVACHAHTPWGKVRVQPSPLGDQAALLAGEWLVKERLAGTV
jgi:glucokinase